MDTVKADKNGLAVSKPLPLGRYKIVCRTNLSGDPRRTSADNLSTAKNYVLDASPSALGLASNEFDYRQRGQFEWAGPAILFVCLVFTLTAPLYVWTIIGV